MIKTIEQDIHIWKRTFKHLFHKVNSERVANFVWLIVRTVLILGLSFIILYPLFVKFTTAIKSAADLTDPTVVFIPKHVTFSNFKSVWIAVDYPFTLLKSAGFILLLSILQIASCTCVAYGLARFKFKGRGIMFALIILTLVIPPQSMLLPLYIRFRYFGLTNLFQFTGQLSGIDLTNTAIPFVLLSITAVAFKNGLYIFLLRQYFRNMPVVLEEAAYIDGYNVFQTFYRIMLPGAVPMMLTVLLFSFVWQWNDTYYMGILAPNLPLLVNKLLGMTFTVMGKNGDIYNAMLNSPKLMLLIAPLLILFIFAQRFFTESIERSGITG